MNCFETLFAGQGVSCAVNPTCGHEAEANIKRSASPRRVLIVGAGPAGLEAARVFALKGDQVTVWEKSSQIGGQWNIASVPPGKKEFASLLIYYAAMLHDLGVDLVLEKEAAANNIAQQSFDMVFIATGANAASPPIPVKGDANIINAWDVLQGENVVGPNIVVVGGGSVGCETALYLAEKGTLDAESLRFLFVHQAETPQNLFNQLTKGSFCVKVVEMGSRPASDMISAIRWTVRKQMHILGVQTLTQTRVLNIDGNQVHVLTEQESEKILLADTVVMAVGATSNNKLYNEIKDNMPCVYLLGDAEKTGKVVDAIHNTFHLVKEL
ncbi:MAG: FAD-dependent oxidoreductase [Bacillota bacterium]|nr:FAD-dependent oxidoreductase [Bacillota bacterium]